MITVGAADIGTSLGAGDDTARAVLGLRLHRGRLREAGSRGTWALHDRPGPGELHASDDPPANVTAPGYMQLSGTSFAAPVVAAAAATLMAQHPNWTPDQVKGALMVTATPEPKAPKGSLGVGEIEHRRLLVHGRRTRRTRTPA